MDDRAATEMISYALEMDPELLPFAPALLAGLDALGADVPLIVSAIAALHPGPIASVVDLGSGKGAVALAIASELGLQVHGIELFEPFVHHGRRAAEQAGLAARCRFTHGDIRTSAATTDLADVAVFAALGDVLGPLDETVAVIREYVRPGGHLVINDSCLRDGTTATFPGFEHYGTLAETRRMLEAHGDRIVAEWFEEDDGSDTDEADLVATNARELARREPALAAAIDAFAHGQRAEYDYLAEHTIGAVWVVERT